MISPEDCTLIFSSSVLRILISGTWGEEYLARDLNSLLLSDGDHISSYTSLRRHSLSGHEPGMRSPKKYYRIRARVPIERVDVGYWGLEVRADAVRVHILVRTMKLDFFFGIVKHLPDSISIMTLIYNQFYSTP